MEYHAQESGSRGPAAPSSSSTKKKASKKKAQASKKTAPSKPQPRSEIPVLRVIDGNASPASHQNANGPNEQAASPASARRDQNPAYEDAGNDENAGLPARTRPVQPKKSNASLNGDTPRASIADEAEDHFAKTPVSKSPGSHSTASSRTQVNEASDSNIGTNRLDKQEVVEPETYAEALKEDVEDSGNGGLDGQSDSKGQDVHQEPKEEAVQNDQKAERGENNRKEPVREEDSKPKANGYPVTDHTSDGLRQRQAKTEKLTTYHQDDYYLQTHTTIEKPGDDQSGGYPALSTTGTINGEGRIDSYEAGGVRFAPWNVPVQRRLQTLAVMIHCLSIASMASFFFFLCAIPLTWPLLIPYLLHILLSKAATDGRLRLRSERFRRLPFWKYFADYFPARLHKTHDLPPTRKYIFGYHPHGIISHGAFAAFGTEALGFSEKFPGITNSLLTLDSNFRIPIYREYILSLGIRSVSKDSILNTLSRGGPNGEGMGRAVTIVVGGARESLEAQPGTMHLVLGERKGFIKLAIRTGADLVPVLAFGENDLYDQVNPETHPRLRQVQMYVLRTLKFTLPFLHGRGIFNYDVGLMPYRRPLNIVVGKPIKVTQARNGMFEPQEVDRLHGLYVAELTKMWETYKDQFVPRRTEEMQIMK
ncbi:diacylglycerol acyltransferase-domain-containing protein [Apodospora peruviana]|uniref:diacylglycerol O-acyltransferase n=1 Tax=Apodospora peruviana TaxID=516989 RepID=A0AAE0MGS3_9PEZI|nr:diacylglycerol acyltransferase-domain-containing protein [Apodospora peruviana]